MAWSKDPNTPELNENDEICRWVFKLSPSEGDRCFTCGEPVVHPVIYWSGVTAHIWLHRECAVGLINGLTLDVERAERMERLRKEHERKGEAE